MQTLSGSKSITIAFGGMSTLPVDDVVRRYNTGHDEEHPPVPASAEQIYDFWACVEMKATKEQDLIKVRTDIEIFVYFASLGAKSTKDMEMPPLELYAAAMRAGKMAWQARELPGSAAEIADYTLDYSPAKDPIRIGELWATYDCETLATGGMNLMWELPYVEKFKPERYEDFIRYRFDLMIERLKECNRNWNMVSFSLRPDANDPSSLDAAYDFVGKYALKEHRAEVARKREREAREKAELKAAKRARLKRIFLLGASPKTDQTEQHPPPALPGS